MTGFNPWIDVAVIAVAFMALATICFIGHKYDKSQKSKLRGATRVA